MKELIFCYKVNCVDQQGERDVLIEALAGHVGLRKLELTGFQIGREGHIALAELLQNTRSNLSPLVLFNINIDDELTSILSSGLNGNSSLRELDLGCSPNHNHNLTEVGWQTIIDVFKSPTCSLKNLNLSGYYIKGGNPKYTHIDPPTF